MKKINKKKALLDCSNHIQKYVIDFFIFEIEDIEEEDLLEFDSFKVNALKNTINYLNPENIIKEKLNKFNNFNQEKLNTIDKINKLTKDLPISKNNYLEISQLVSNYLSNLFLFDFDLNTLSNNELSEFLIHFRTFLLDTGKDCYKYIYTSSPYEDHYISCVRVMHKRINEALEDDRVFLLKEKKEQEKFYYSIEN